MIVPVHNNIEHTIGQIEQLLLALAEVEVGVVEAH
jgi:hypothetical protein